MRGLSYGHVDVSASIVTVEYLMDLRSVVYRTLPGASCSGRMWQHTNVASAAYETVAAKVASPRQQQRPHLASRAKLQSAMQRQLHLADLHRCQ